MSVPRSPRRGPPANEGLRTKVKEWVEKGGLPLELQTKAAFKKEAFSVTHSAVYVDPETEKGREIDVIANSRDWSGMVQINFVAECKSSPQPWVVLVDRDDFPKPIYYSLGVVSENIGAMLRGVDWDPSRSEAWRVLEYMHAGGYGIRQAFSNNNDPAYAAAMAALKASRAIALKPMGTTKRFQFAIPVIVVDAPIFECSVGADGELEYLEVQSSEFFFNAYIPEEVRASIRIVRKEELVHFTKTCRLLAESLKTLLKPKVDEFIASIRGRGTSGVGVTKPLSHGDGIPPDP